MRTLVFLSTMIIVLLPTANAWSCDKTTYAGCSPEELRAIQQQQFQARKQSSSDAADYWRDREYADRVRAEEQNHELELEKIRAHKEVEVAKQQRRSRKYGSYYYYRPPVVVRSKPPIAVYPKPRPPVVVKPKPELKTNIYSKRSYKKVSSAIK